MLHRALFGSIERFLGILIEHFAGRFPLWISPHHVRILTVADRHQPYAESLCSQIKAAGFHCDVDDTSESVSKKVRNAQLAQIWHVIDAQGVVLGKLATKAAMLLMGKTKPTYTPFLDTGDHVIVINAAKVRLTRPERRKQGIPPFHRVPGRAGGEELQAGARRKAHPHRGGSHSGHASQDQARQTDVPETEGLCG